MSETIAFPITVEQKYPFVAALLSKDTVDQLNDLSIQASKERNADAFEETMKVVKEVVQFIVLDILVALETKDNYETGRQSMLEVFTKMKGKTSTEVHQLLADHYGDITLKRMKVAVEKQVRSVFNFDGEDDTDDETDLPPA